MIDGRRDPSRGEKLGIACIVAVLVAFLAALAFSTGVTVDEPSHLLSSYLYWEGRDTLRPGDMPPLIKIMGGWVPHLTGLRLPDRNNDAWKNNHEWDISYTMMINMSAAEIARTFPFARLPMIVFPAGCCLLIWWWGRQLFSPVAALAAALAWALCSLVLGHGALFKNDLAASFAFLFFWRRAWVFWRKPDCPGAFWLGIGTLAMVMSKFSLLVFTPVAPALVLLRAASLRVRFKETALWMLLLLVVPYAGIQLSWQSPLSRISPLEVDAWAQASRKPALSVAGVKAMAALRLPPRFVRGVATLVDSNESGGVVYMLGKLHPKAHPAYFLLALAVKLDVALLLLIAAGVIAAASNLISRWQGLESLLWFCPGFLYLLLASFSNLQLGARLVLPAVAFFILACGSWIDWARRSRTGIIVTGILFAWMAGSAAMTYPHYISSFNVIAGGAENGLTYFSDSNIDWGQDARRLAAVIREKHIPKLRLAYFGMDNPFAYLTGLDVEPLTPPWSDNLVAGTRFNPDPGYYAVSATLLTGQFFAEKYRDYFAAFRRLTPIAKAGHSIWVFHIPASSSPMQELSPTAGLKKRGPA